MIEIEREYTFLINRLPDDLAKFPSKIIEDIYIPISSRHPVIRIRRNGDRREITKKYPVDSVDEMGGDSSHMVEHTIPLSQAEYDALASLPGKQFKKRRFAYKVNGYDAEVDIYLDKLAGLAFVDFEFDSEKSMAKFQKPVFAGADVAQDEMVAGGMLCGKTIADLAPHLAEKYGYKPLSGIERYKESKSPHKTGKSQVAFANLYSNYSKPNEKSQVKKEEK